MHMIVYSCTRQCTHVHDSVLMYTTVYSCTRQCTHVHDSVLMYTTVYSTGAKLCDILGSIWQHHCIDVAASM